MPGVVSRMFPRIRPIAYTLTFLPPACGRPTYRALSALLILSSFAAQSAYAANDASDSDSKADLVINDVQFNCMKFVMNAIDEPFTLDGSGKAEAEYFGKYPVTVLPDGSYKVLVSYKQLGNNHQASCTARKARNGSWTQVDKKDLK